jgi:hypothetical protein
LLEAVKVDTPMTAAETHERSATVAGKVQFRENDGAPGSIEPKKETPVPREDRRESALVRVAADWCICVAVEGGQMHEDAEQDRGSARATERLETKKAGDLSRLLPWQLRDATDKPSCIKTIQSGPGRVLDARAATNELNAIEGELLLERRT